MCLPICFGAGPDGCCLCGIPCDCCRANGIRDGGPIRTQPNGYY